ncbi:MAG: hypothetical protein JWP18_950 [Solirubrobacterales bacterium]|nr:hypothetical protein [Solirubrobacterales bacterium]
MPPVAFVVAYTASGQDTTVSATVALVVGVLLAVARVARRETLQHALTGLIGVALAAFIATRTGKAENFFLPGLLANAAYALVYFVSIVIRRPLIGVIVSSFSGSGSAWRQDARLMRTYTRASWLWVALFLLRLLVQLPLYLAGSVTALGVARTAMGLPLFGLGIWLTWLTIRPAMTAGATTPPASFPPDDADQDAGDGATLVR